MPPPLPPNALEAQEGKGKQESPGSAEQGPCQVRREDLIFHKVFPLAGNIT